MLNQVRRDLSGARIRTLTFEMAELFPFLGFPIGLINFDQRDVSLLEAISMKLWMIKMMTSSNRMFKLICRMFKLICRTAVQN